MLFVVHQNSVSFDATVSASEASSWISPQFAPSHLLGNLLHITRLPALCLSKGGCLCLVAEQDVDARQRVQQCLLERRHLTAAIMAVYRLSITSGTTKFHQSWHALMHFTANGVSREAKSIIQVVVTKTGTWGQCTQLGSGAARVVRDQNLHDEGGAQVHGIYLVGCRCVL